VTCPFTQDAAAYVLGALSPAERLEFERHLDGCYRCTEALGELAGLPGLLSRVDASVLESPPAAEPVPASVLPALSRQVRRARRRRTVAAAGLAGAVVAVIAPLILWLVGDGRGEVPPEPGSSSTSPVAEARDMEPVGDVPLRASITLEKVAWGTRLGVTCTYDPDWGEYRPPAAVRYTLVVRTRDGSAEEVGSWRSEGGRKTRLSAATAEALADIESVEVRAPDGRVVLRLGA
jgi:hypothetical protein